MKYPNPKRRVQSREHASTIYKIPLLLTRTDQHGFAFHSEIHFEIVQIRDKKLLQCAVIGRHSQHILRVPSDDSGRTTPIRTQSSNQKFQMFREFLCQDSYIS